MAAASARRSPPPLEQREHRRVPRSRPRAVVAGREQGRDLADVETGCGSTPSRSSAPPRAPPTNAPSSSRCPDRSVTTPPSRAPPHATPTRSRPVCTARPPRSAAARLRRRGAPRRHRRQRRVYLEPGRRAVPGRRRNRRHPPRHAVRQHLSDAAKALHGTGAEEAEPPPDQVITNLTCARTAGDGRPADRRCATLWSHRLPPGPAVPGIDGSWSPRQVVTRLSKPPPATGLQPASFRRPETKTLKLCDRFPDAPLVSTDR